MLGTSLQVFSVYALHSVGDAASYSANSAHSKSFCNSVFYQLAFGNDHLQILHTHQDLSIQVFVSISIGCIVNLTESMNILLCS